MFKDLLKINWKQVPKPLLTTYIVLMVLAFSSLYMHYPLWWNIIVAIALIVCVCILAKKYTTMNKQ